jgi:hypothetical protein
MIDLTLTSNSLFVLGGETCVNNEDLNGTVFGSFRCPIYGFSTDEKYCCGEYGEQFCCRGQNNRFVLERILFC